MLRWREGQEVAKPFVSVLIDTYNHERFIEQAVRSVLEQDFPASDREILVVDDGSTDCTAEILKKFEPQIRVLRRQNGGQASAFNTGIPECRGELVAFLDGDDWWKVHKLRAVIEALERKREVGIVGHGIVHVERDGAQRPELLREGFIFQANTRDGARLLRRRGSFLGTSRMTIRRSLLQKIGRVPDAIAVQADEYLFTLAAVLMGVQILPDSLTFYRLHTDNSFELGSYNIERLRRKQSSLAALAEGLRHRLRELGLAETVIHEIVALTEASATQLRLMLDGGWPWETVKTESRLYSILHPEATWSQRGVRTIALLGGMLLPPRAFYRARRMLSQSLVYKRTRERWLPVPKMPHIEKT